MSKPITKTQNLNAVGPYSLAVESNNTLYCSGQIPIDKDKNVIGNTTVEQFHQVMKNINELLSEAGYSLKDIVKVTLLLADINDFAAVNEVYATYLSEPFPARSTFQVGALPMGVKVEMEIIATKN